METPLPLHKGPAAKSHFSCTKNAAGERSALHDITNDSPIVGLAAGGLTPSTASKTRPRPRRTPGSGSGEALLRGQVKTLLHRVHQDACAAITIRPARIHALLGLGLGVSRSPAQLLAPTPANTPQLAVAPASASASREDLIPMLQAIEEKLGECQLNRALVFDDSPGKSSDASSSVWSVQVNPSDEDALGELEDDDEDCLDDVCEGMSRVTVADDQPVGLPAFEGKHTRFVYSSDEEEEAPATASI